MKKEPRKALTRPLRTKVDRQYFNGKWFETKRYFAFGFEIKQWREHYEIFPFQNQFYHKIFNTKY